MSSIAVYGYSDNIAIYGYGAYTSFTSLYIYRNLVVPIDLFIDLIVPMVIE